MDAETAESMHQYWLQQELIAERAYEYALDQVVYWGLQIAMQNKPRLELVEGDGTIPLC